MWMENGSHAALSDDAQREVEAPARFFAQIASNAVLGMVSPASTMAKKRRTEQGVIYDAK